MGRVLESVQRNVLCIGVGGGRGDVNKSQGCLRVLGPGRMPGLHTCSEVLTGGTAARLRGVASEQPSYPRSCSCVCSGTPADEMLSTGRGAPRRGAGARPPLPSPCPRRALPQTALVSS